MASRTLHRDRLCAVASGSSSSTRVAGVPMRQCRVVVPHATQGPERNRSYATSDSCSRRNSSDVLDGRPGSAEVEYCRLQINREFEQVD